MRAVRRVRCGRFLGIVAVLLMTFALRSAEDGSLEAPFSGTVLDSEFGVGSWIWMDESADKQTCRLWRAFEVPESAVVVVARLRITADNGYRLMLNGRELGRGSDWRSLTEYDLTSLVGAGRHVLAIEAFNDRLLGGVLVGLRLEFSDGRILEIASDESWQVAPESAVGWERRLQAPLSWPHATVVGAFRSDPWEEEPYAITVLPALQPIPHHFWQSGWFQISLLSTCLLALGACLWLAGKLTLQSRAQTVLQRERARIARDIHDDLGAGLTELVLQGEVAQTELPEGSPARLGLDQLCEKARSVSHLLEEVVWAVNSRRDTVRDFASYSCKYAQTFFQSSNVRCRLDVETEMPEIGFDLPVRRNVFLAVKEALNNVARHSKATEVHLRIHRRGAFLAVEVEDNGKGFAVVSKPGEHNGLMNMKERLKEAGGVCRVESRPDAGCRVVFQIPLTAGQRVRNHWLRRSRKTSTSDSTLPSEVAALPRNPKKSQA